MSIMCYFVGRLAARHLIQSTAAHMLKSIHLLLKDSSLRSKLQKKRWPRHPEDNMSIMCYFVGRWRVSLLNECKRKLSTNLVT